MLRYLPRCWRKAQERKQCPESNLSPKDSKDVQNILKNSAKQPQTTRTKKKEGYEHEY